MTASPFALAAALLTATALLNCSSTDDGGEGGSASTSSAGGSSTGGSTTTGPGTGGGTSSTGGGGGAGGSGGAGGGPVACPMMTLNEQSTAMCAQVGSTSMAVSDTTECPADTSVYWPTVVYEVPVSDGDCLWMSVDNAGSAMGSDLYAAILDPMGLSLLFDDEHPCAETNPEGYACPEGAMGIAGTGNARIIVGAWEGAGCTPMSAEPIQLSVAVNGVDVDLSAAFLCEDDFLQYTP